MITFLIGLVILAVGSVFYSRLCVKAFGPDDRKTPAFTKEDGVDYVPMRVTPTSISVAPNSPTPRDQVSTMDGPRISPASNAPTTCGS